MNLIFIINFNFNKQLFYDNFYSDSENSGDNSLYVVLN